MIEKISQYVVIATCLFCIGFLVVTRTTLFQKAPPVDIRVGQTLSYIPRPSPTSEAKTLVLGIQTHCEWCKKDMPIYQKLSSAPAVKDGRVYVVAVLPPGNHAEALAFVKDNQIQARLYEHDPFPFNATPTLTLLDSAHKVLKVWKGALTEDRQKELFAELN